MSGKFVRASSYRHVFGEAPKKEQQFTDVRPNPNGDGNCCSANAKYVAAPCQGGGGPVMVLGVDNAGRQNKHAKVSVHKSKVTDLAWNPFLPSMLATASEDCMINLTMVDAAGVKEGKTFDDSVAKLKGHQKKLLGIQWHPTASGVLGSISYDNTVKIWDAEKQTAINTIKHSDEKGCFGMKWNAVGSLLGVTLKNKTISLYDPRTNGDGAKVGPGTEGTKCPRLVFCDNLNKLVVFGFTRSSQRQYKVYDLNDVSKPICTDSVDQASGLMCEHYDPDTNIIYLAGKGDSSVKYFEITEKSSSLHFLSEFSDSKSQKGIGWAPKYSLDTTKCEIARAYRVLSDAIQPVSFCVPRKSDMFQEDIFPDTASWEPAHDAASYFGGADKEPIKVTMDPEQRGDAPKEEATFAAKKSYEELEAELAAALKRIAELEGK